MSLVKARDIIDLAPENLHALVMADFPTEGPTVHVCAVGDIGLSGRVGVNISSKAGGDALFAEVAPILQNADISFGNLETPLAGEIAQGGLFSAPISGAAILRKSGFRVVHLANTHAYDYGQAGLAATLDAVRNADLIPLGAHDNPSAVEGLVRTDMNGLRIGWLSCGHTLVRQDKSGPSYWEYDEHRLLNAVERHRRDVDILIVSIHLGLMYMDYPRPEHKTMAETLIKAGVDLILMHHAHVLQGVELFNRSVCCYNLGNFVFDCEEGHVQNSIMVREQKESAVFYFVLDRRGVAKASAFPIWTDDGCRVHWANGKRGAEILSRLTKISHGLKDNFIPLYKRQRAERNTPAIFKVIWLHFRHGNWSDVWESLKKARPEHVGMLVRWLCSRLKRRSKRTTA
jgi:hypothetical protein